MRGPAAALAWLILAAGVAPAGIAVSALGCRLEPDAPHA